MNELNNLENILTSFLGESKNGLSGGQIQFCCPQCAEDNGVESDGKFNLEINVLRGGGVYRCWKCELENDMSGKLSNLIKKYGNSKILEEYREEIKNIKNSKDYEFNLLENGFIIEEDDEMKITFPEKTYDFKFDNNKRESRALKYLSERNISPEIIKKYDLKYTDNYCQNKNFKNRIIIPSYDKFNQLNYFTGRDYIGNQVRKYFNLENSNRKDIVFNEKLINWDGDIVLVEGPFDHIVIPNSIPMMGKALNRDHYLYSCVTEKSTSNIFVFLDDDAYLNALHVCNIIYNINTYNRLKIIPTSKLKDTLNKKKGLNLKKLDPSKLYELYGKKGISWALKNAEDYNPLFT